jgi:hypothetical protein
MRYIKRTLLSSHQVSALVWQNHIGLITSDSYKRHCLLHTCHFLTSTDKMSLLPPTYFPWNFNSTRTKYVSTIHFRETTYVYGTIFLKCDIFLAINILNVMHLRILNILSRNSKTWYLSSAEWCSCFDLVSHCSRSSCEVLS